MRRTILYLAFFLSGAAGLVYEVVWSRYLSLFVGHSAEAQVLVIGMFLGGLALGSTLVGRVSDSIERPLRAYVLFELAIAVLGLSFHFVFQGITGLAYTMLFPALGSTLLVSSLKWVIASLLVFVPAVFLGATFPLMAAGVNRLGGANPGRVVGSLYCLNSLGGAVFILVAGFGLVPTLGLPGTLGVAVLLNVLAAGGAEWGRRSPVVADAAAPEPTPLAHDELTAGLWRLLFATSALTAIASFSYQIGWIRMLSLVMGSATHAFEIMLSAFILGLAIGSFWIRRTADTTARPLRALGRIQWLMGFLALATLPVYAASFGWVSELLNALPETTGGYRTFNVARYGIAIAVMLPATVLAGMTLPLITATLLRARSGERAIGFVYGVNTAGAIVGVMAAGLLALPVLGLKGMLIAGALLDMALGVVLLGWDTDRARTARLASAMDESGSRRGVVAWLGPPLSAGVLTMAAIFVFMTGQPFDRAVLTSGVYRYGALDPAGQRVLYYADGRTATVGVHQTPDDLIVLTSNGKPDASLTGRWLAAIQTDGERRPIVQQDESTQMLTALITLAHAPHARRAAIVGHGSGVSGHFLLTSATLDSVVTIEIEPRMVDASSVFYPANRLVFDDGRSRIAIADARSFLAERGEPYDIILSEPSNPWVSGVSSLFTVEFYRRVRERLSDTGVFAQWIHLYEIDDGLVGTVLSAIHQSFPSYGAYLVGDSDIMILATKANTLPRPDWRLLDSPVVLRETRHFPRLRPDHLEGLKLFERDEVAPLFPAWARANSDYRPVLDTGTERTRFTDSFSQGFYGLGDDRFQIAAALGGWARLPGRSLETPIRGLAPMRARAHAVGARTALADPTSVIPRDARPTARAVYSGFSRMLSPPSDHSVEGWTGWVDAFVVTERLIHAGTAGFADRAFYRKVREQLEGRTVPAEVVAVVDFHEGLASWDFEQAAVAAEVIVADVLGAGAGSPGGGSGGPRRITDPVHRSTLLDGAVVSFLKSGRAHQARGLLDRLGPLTNRAEGDFRNALLSAHIDLARGRATALAAR